MSKVVESRIPRESERRHHRCIRRHPPIPHLGSRAAQQPRQSATTLAPRTHPAASHDKREISAKIGKSFVPIHISAALSPKTPPPLQKDVFIHPSESCRSASA